MKTCLARRRLLDDHQLARFDQVPQGMLSRASVYASNVDHTTDEDSLKNQKENLKEIYEKQQRRTTDSSPVTHLYFSD